jgi:hypothetical protein
VFPAQAHGSTEPEERGSGYFDELPGKVIGRYRLLEKIGEGGFGSVYVAEQMEPVRRKVALKIIKPGMDSRQVVARFEVERQALALMDHPNIAKVLDGGATESGRPYFVMELIHGVPITKYCDDNNLSAEKRLKLFSQTCDALHHAHEAGIIHRDIKPSNILVAFHGGLPVPKVIDFGIAKATMGNPLTDKTVFTCLEQFLGTPAYVSPEQAEMSALEIDKRTDVYSLGVLLYELLVGATPFDSRELIEAGLDAMRRAIREREPLRPSRRMSGLPPAQQTTVAKRLGAEPPELINLLKGDLDCIVMKALQKDRTLRYDSAKDFAQDVERYLAHDPVSAVAPSVGYKLRRFVGRKRVTLSVAVAMAFLIGALMVSLYMLWGERRSGGMCEIRIRTEPKGAEVWYEGREIGVTPIRVADLLPGSIVYGLLLTNYEPVSITNRLEAGMRMNDLTFLRPMEPGQAHEARVKQMTAFWSRSIILQSVQGTVQILPPGGKFWISTAAGQELWAGYRVRTGPGSRALLRWQDDSVVAIDELTEMEVLRPTKGDDTVNNGTIKVYNEDGTTNRIEVITRGASAAIRG